MGVKQVLISISFCVSITLEQAVKLTLIPGPDRPLGEI